MLLLFVSVSLMAPGTPINTRMLLYSQFKAIF